MFRGKVRYDKSCNRWYVDLHHKGRRDKTYKYLGVMPCPGRHKRRSPMHLAEYARVWTDTLDIEDSTRHDYQNSLKNHILPALGTRFLPDITADELKVFQKGIKRMPKGKKNVMDTLDDDESGYGVRAYSPAPGVAQTESRKTKNPVDRGHRSVGYINRNPPGGSIHFYLYGPYRLSTKRGHGIQEGRHI